MSSDGSGFVTPQEEFWAGSFGTDYIDRNRSQQLLASNLRFFSDALRRAGRIESCVELGANIGMNLKALKLLYPELQAKGVEINSDAVTQLAALVGTDNAVHSSIFDWRPSGSVDLAFTKGVLIHLNPERLPDAYDRLYEASSRLVLIGEYYNPSPVAISYRGHSDRLYKRDFAGEIMDRYPDLTLVDYGFSYRRDPVFPQDDISWFLMEKAGR